MAETKKTAEVKTPKTMTPGKTNAAKKEPVKAKKQDTVKPAAAKPKK